MGTRVFPMDNQGRSMVGMLSLPESPPSQAWLLLFPFGQEAIRATPMYRTLADRLERNGAAALRFDFHGLGDSAGEPAQQSLNDWIEDTLHAIRTLQATARTSRVRLFGVGLGGTLGALAALRAPPGIDTLVMWQPVIDGTRYIETLKATHRREVARGFDMSWAEVHERLAEPEPTVPGNLLGFEVGAALLEGLTALKALPLEALAARGVSTTIALADDTALEPLAAASRANAIRIEAPIDWMANEALGTALVPQQLIALLDRLSRPS